MIKKLIFTFANTVILFLMSWSFTYAAPNTPEFPACSNPTGSVKVQYSTGNHGIAGSTQTFSGSDTVYQLNENTLTQCFCADNGNGTQTNWWKISELTQVDIDTLINLGWVFVANGADWGLSNDPYMAFNSTYTCKSTTQVNSSSTSSSSGSVASASTGVGGNVLGLATTGDSAYILTVFMTGILLFATGVLLRKAK